MKLLHKFFLAFFVTNITLVGLVLVLIALSFSSGFNDFVTEAENKHVAGAKQQLITVYQQQNSWFPIIDNVQVWRDIVDPQAKRQPLPPPAKENPRPAQDYSRSTQGYSDRAEDRPKPTEQWRPPPEENPPRREQPPKPRAERPEDFLKTGKRLSLYDAHKNVIVGKNNIQENPRTEPINLNGELIGWLGLVPSNAVKDSPSSEFLTKQYESYYLIAMAIIVLAFAMALMLSKHLIAPIKLIIEGTSKLIAGHYQSRINKVTADELGVVADNFNDLAHTLEQNQKNRFQWMSDTSHELRTPLTVLRSHLIAIQDGVFIADEKRVQLFIDEIDNLSHIVDDLYQLSSSDAGGLTYKKVELNPLLILIQVIEAFKAKFEQHGLMIEYASLVKTMNSSNGNILGDKDRLRQLFSNLLENTCRYTHAPGNIRISAKLDKHTLGVSVEDSAPSVTAEQSQKLFERFYRVEKSRNRSQGGSGLGLALCKQIVEAHRGDISALDSALGGLHIKLTFPTVFSTIHSTTKKHKA